jgi:hypothetical protein
VNEDPAAPQPNVDEIKLLSDVLAALQKLDQDARERILRAIAAYFKIGIRAGNSFSEDRFLSPKEFIVQKQPRSEVDKAACLAFYLTHYRDTPHFKTRDISKVNKEAAQVRFSNASVAVANAMQKGLLVSVPQGQKQLSAIGEQYVLRLPYREAAWEARKMALRRWRKNPKSKQNSAEEMIESTDDQQGN